MGHEDASLRVAVETGGLRQKRGWPGCMIGAFPLSIKDFLGRI
jgi:hypothetical protein